MALLSWSQMAWLATAACGFFAGGAIFGAWIHYCLWGAYRAVMRAQVLRQTRLCRRAKRKLEDALRQTSTS